jgi:hypothetical protein
VDVGDVPVDVIKGIKQNIVWQIHDQVPQLTIKSFNVYRYGKRTTLWITITPDKSALQSNTIGVLLKLRKVINAFCAQFLNGV